MLDRADVPYAVVLEAVGHEPQRLDLRRDVSTVTTVRLAAETSAVHSRPSPRASTIAPDDEVEGPNDDASQGFVDLRDPWPRPETESIPNWANDLAVLASPLRDGDEH